MAIGRIIESVIGPEGGTGLKIKNLRQTMMIEKTDKKDAQNKCQLTIYGVARSRLSYAAEGNVIQISAGYADEGIQPIFFGEIIHSEGVSKGEQYSLRIEATDGATAFSSRFLSLSYAPGTPKSSAISDILKTLALPSVPRGFSLPGSFPNGYSFIGKAIDALSEVLESEGYTWSIQNGKIAIYKPGNIVESTGVLLSFSTGLLEKPEPLSGKEVTGYKVKSLLYPQLLPGTSFRIDADSVNTDLRVKSVTFDGDTEGEEFIAMTEGEIL